MKRIHTKIIVIIVLGMVLWFFLEGKDQGAPEEIEISALLDLSGPAAFQGEEHKEGIESAVKNFEMENNIKVKVNFEDTKFLTKEGINAFNKVKKYSDGVITQASNVSLGVSGINKDILQFAITTSADKFSEKGGQKFRLTQRADQVSDYIVDDFNEAGYKKVAVLVLNGDFGKSYSDNIEEKFEGEVFTQLYNIQETDFKTQLLKIKEFEVDAIFMLGLPSNYVNISKQAEEVGLAQEDFYAMWTIEDDRVKENVPRVMEIKYHFPGVKNNSQAGPYFIEGYEAARLILESIKRCMESEIDRECVSEFMSNSDEVKIGSLIEGIEFDEYGDIKFPMTNKILRNGEFIVE